MVFYVAGIVTTISMLGRSLLCYSTSPPTASWGRKTVGARQGRWRRDNRRWRAWEKRESDCKSV